MKKTSSGFTIVELVVVIAIIAILDILTLVGYSFVQAQARNAQTTSAANQWLKILKMYQSRNGGYPSSSTCLGDKYSYGVTNTATSGVGMCRQTSSSAGVIVDETVMSTLSKYYSSRPTPAMVTASNSATSWHRGVYYLVSGTSASLYFVLDGGGVSSCPSTFGNIANDTSSSAKATNGNYLCAYPLGQISGY